MHTYTSMHVVVHSSKPLKPAFVGWVTCFKTTQFIIVVVVSIIIVIIPLTPMWQSVGITVAKEATKRV